VIPLIFLSVSVFAEPQPTENTVYQRDHQLDTAAGPFFVLGIHPKKADAPKKCSASISVVFRVGNFETSLFGLARFDRKKIRTKASLHTFTIQKATKLLSGEEKYEPD
jgi:hypothetical protein